MTIKEFIKNLFMGVLFVGAIYIFIMVFMYFIENEVNAEEIFNPKIRINYNIIPDEVLLHHSYHHQLQPKSREELLIEASEHPERFTDEELVKLLLD